MIKLVLSILLPVFFLANYWVCDWLYPGASMDWAIFIPMDELAHNFWAFIMFGYIVVALFKTKYAITDYFLFIGLCFSLCDITARAAHLYNYIPSLYLLELIGSLIMAGILYGIKYGKFKKE